MNNLLPSDSRTLALASAVSLGKDGRFLDALDELRRCGDLRAWTGQQRCEVAWIVSELGAPRLSRWHVLKAFREEPEAPSVRVAYAQLVADDNGPLDAIEFIESLSPPGDEDDVEERMKWLWLQCSALTQLRDFSAAAEFIEQMEAFSQRRDILHFTRSLWLERQDKYDEALREIELARAERESRSTVGYQSYLLTLVGRDEEAYELLREFDERKQVASVSWQMSGMAYERRDYAECQRLLERFESLSPLLERSFGERFTMFRSELARRRGDDAAAIQYAERAKSAFGKKIAERLADPSRKERVDKVLPVEFVRQHEMTCGPATLSAISRYWGRSAEHLEVAEEICYNGTTNHAERNWATQNGFATKEFTVDEDSTEALIARDVPFTLVTRGAGFAHLQAVIGFDGRTGTILIRDPFYRVRGTMALDELLESQAAYGPRGMVLVPSEQATLIDVELPDADLYDLLHSLDGALIAHRREEAIGFLEKIAEQAPEHRLRWQAQRQLAIYDGDEIGILDAVQKLLAMYPDDVSLQLSELSLLKNLGRTDERVRRLRELAEEPLAHPLLKLQLAESLVLDGRYRDEAESLLRDAIRTGTTFARSYLELGDLRWQRQDRETALRLYRFAACLDDKDEYLATRFFDASVALGRTEEALEWLRGRFSRFGKKSMQPAITLYESLARLRRHEEGIAILDEAMSLRPDDTELVLAVVHFLATASSEYWPRAEALLESVQSTAPERGWNEAASQLAVVKGDWKSGLEHLRKLLPRSPLSMGLRERIEELVFEIEGEDAAIENWRRAAEEFPHYQPLLERYAMALRSRPLDEIEPVLQKILEQSPDNAWANRELAQHLLAAGKLDEAEARIAKCVELDGENAFAIVLQASLDARRGNVSQARTRLRELLAGDISDEYVVSKLLGFCENVEQRAEELEWVLGELRKQPITGDVLLVYRDYAEAIVAENVLLESMREAVASRSELWYAHKGLIRQLTQMQRLDEAASEAEKATKLFPLEPDTWYEQYRVASAAGDLALQRSSLERCRLLRPNNATVIRSLSDILCSEGKYSEARDMLQTLVAEQPLDAVNRGYLADALTELGELELALAEYSTAASLEPEYDYAWRRLEDMADALNRPDERLELSTRLTKEKPHSAGVWLHHARSLLPREQFDEVHKALDQAELIEPYRENLHTLRSRAFANFGDIEAAMQALQPSVFAKVPATLEAARAQLMWDIGDQDAAYELIQKTANENPEAVGIWALFEQWATIREERTMAILAVEHQVRMQPHDPDVLDAAGHSFLALESKPKAIEAFRRAIEIAPTFAGSRCKLFDLLAEQENWSDAATVISDLPRCDQHPSVIARRMEVSLHQKNRAQAEADLDAILTSQDWSSWAIDRAGELLSQAGLKSVFMQQVEKRLLDESANGDLGRVWAESKLDGIAKPGRRCVAEISERIGQWANGENEEAARCAASALLQTLGRHSSSKLLKRFIAQNEAFFQKDIRTWSMVAFTYADNPTQFSRAQMRNWIKDWERHQDYEPWMLTNIHELCRITGDHHGGRKAVQMAVSLPPDNTHSQLRLWAAHDALVDGDPQMAMRHFMAAARVEYLQGYDRLLHHWVEAVLYMLQSDDRSAAFANISKQLDGHGLTAEFFKKQPVYREIYVHSVKTVAKLAGTWQAKWWAFTMLLPVRTRWLHT